jgi:hypothetical protein
VGNDWPACQTRKLEGDPVSALDDIAAPGRSGAFELALACIGEMLNEINSTAIRAMIAIAGNVIFRFFVEIILEPGGRKVHT